MYILPLLKLRGRKIRRITRTFIIVKSTAGDNNETDRAAIWPRCKT